MPELTLKAAREAVSAIPRPARPGVTVTDGARLVRDLAEDVREARAARDAIQTTRRGCGVESPHAQDRAACAARLSRALPDRTAARSKIRIIHAAKTAIKWGGPGGVIWQTTVASPDRTPNYIVDVDHVRGVYRGAYSGYRAVQDTHRITYPARWWLRVLSVGNGRGVVDGKLVLDARRVFRVEGEPAVHEVLLVRQSRGYTVETERAVLKTWAPDVVTQHRSVRSALDARVPDIIIERAREQAMAAARALAEERRLDEADEDALAGLEL